MPLPFENSRARAIRRSPRSVVSESWCRAVHPRGGKQLGKSEGLIERWAAKSTGAAGWRRMAPTWRWSSATRSRPPREARRPSGSRGSKNSVKRSGRCTSRPSPPRSGAWTPTWRARRCMRTWPTSPGCWKSPASWAAGDGARHRRRPAQGRRSAGGAGRGQGGARENLWRTTSREVVDVEVVGGEPRAQNRVLAAQTGNPVSQTGELEAQTGESKAQQGRSGRDTLGALLFGWAPGRMSAGPDGQVPGRRCDPAEPPARRLGGGAAVRPGRTGRQQSATAGPAAAAKATGFWRRWALTTVNACRG